MKKYKISKSNLKEFFGWFRKENKPDKIQNIIDSSDTHLMDGGIELDEEELSTIYEHICQGLGEMNVQD